MEYLPQLLINTLIISCIYALFATSFWIIYSTTKYFNFAHGAIFTWGAYITYLFNKHWGIPIIISIAMSATLCALLGYFMEKGIFHSLRQRSGSTTNIQLIASLGIYIVLQNAVSLIFGDDTKSLHSGIIETGKLLGNVRITPNQIIIIVISVVMVIAIGVYLKLSRTGKAIRAISNDINLAQISGVDSEKTFTRIYVICSALAAIGGTLVALDTDITPSMGMNALLISVVVLIIGGLSNFFGIFLGAISLGVAQNLGVWAFSSQWQNTIAFLILLIFLFFRPQGFLGRKIKKATI